MTGAEVLDVSRDAIWTIVKVSSPLLVVGLVVGVAISLVQALTQIQEADTGLRAENPRDLHHAGAGAAVHGGCAA
jgi:type III secretory pathway component EscS